MSHNAQPAVPGFDLLRLCAALLVVVQHSYAVTGAWTQEWAMRLSGSQLTCGMIGVGLFFVISGYLVEQSRMRQPGIVPFFTARALRILPALVVVVAAAALVFGPLWTTLPLREYFSHDQTWRYLLNVNLFQVQDNLPGVFKDNFIRPSINGSLWTLPYEVTCYVLLFVVSSVAGRLRTLVLGLAAAALYAIWLMVEAVALVPGARHPLLVGLAGVNSRDLAAFGCMFFAGSALAASGRTLASPVWAVAAAAVLVAAILLGGARQVLPLCLPILGISLAHALGSAFKVRACVGDLSYGVYLWAFPLQQWLVMPGGPQVKHAEAHLLATLLLVMPLAWLSWRYVERPMLKLKSRLR